MFVDTIFICFIVTHPVNLPSLTYLIMLPHSLLFSLGVMLSYTSTPLRFHGFKVTGGRRFPSPVFCGSDHGLRKYHVYVSCEHIK